jgi:hypothetical protein
MPKLLGSRRRRLGRPVARENLEATKGFQQAQSERLKPGGEREKERLK